MSHIEGVVGVSANIFGLFLPVSEENHLYTFLGDTVLQAEPMRLNYENGRKINATDTSLVCSVVELSNTNVVGKLIPLGGASNLHQTPFSVISAGYLKNILKCLTTTVDLDDDISIEVMFQNLLVQLDKIVESNAEGDFNKYIETAKLLLKMFLGQNIITRAQHDEVKGKLAAKCSPWLHLYRVVRLLNVAVIFNNDNIAAIYQHIISVAKLQFNIKDVPALKATLEPVVSEDQDSSTKRLNIQVTGIKTKDEYLQIVEQVHVSKSEKYTILYGVRG